MNRADFDLLARAVDAADRMDTPWGPPLGEVFRELIYRWDNTGTRPALTPELIAVARALTRDQVTT